MSDERRFVPQDMQSHIRDVEHRHGVREKAYVVNEAFCGCSGCVSEGSVWFVDVRLRDAVVSRGVFRGEVTRRDEDK